MEAIKGTFNFFMEVSFLSPLFDVFNILRILSIFFSLFLIIFILFLLKKNNYLYHLNADKRSELYGKKPYYSLDIRERWKETREHVESGKETERRLGVIEADDILKETLDYFGYKGDDLLDKLILLNEAIIPNIEGVKSSHKRVREIFHNPNIDLSKEEAKGIFSIYEVVLKDMEVV